MGRKNRRSNRGMNRRSKRSKRTKMNRRTKMRGGGAVSMVIKNVGSESINVDLWDNTRNTWKDKGEIHPNAITDSHPTSVGDRWRVTGHQRDTVGTKELSWVLGDDGSRQEIHVDFTPSNGSLAWKASYEEVEAARKRAAAAELQRKRAELQRKRAALAALERQIDARETDGRRAHLGAKGREELQPLSLRDAALSNPNSLAAQAWAQQQGKSKFGMSKGAYLSAGY